MAIQKKWPEVGPFLVTTQGSKQGALSLSSAFGLFVGQRVILGDPNPNIPTTTAEIKRIIGIPTGDLNAFPVIEVGPLGSPPLTRIDVSSYGIDSTVFAPEQNRTDIPLQEIERAIFEEEPAVARRSIIVDSFGQQTTLNNPFPVALYGIQITLLNNLLAMQAAGISPLNFIVNNDGFFIADNEGNFIKQG